MMINFYVEDDLVYTCTIKSRYIAYQMVYGWIWADGWSVECKGRRIYKDSKFRPSEKLLNEYVDFIFDGGERDYEH